MLAALLAAPVSSAPPARMRFVHPDFVARMAGVRIVGVVAPALRYHEATPLLSHVPRPDWAEAAGRAVVETVAAALRARGLVPKHFAPSAPEARRELAEVQLLLEYVDAAIDEALYRGHFPAKLARFEYGLGDLHRLLADTDRDALLLVRGEAAVLLGPDATGRGGARNAGGAGTYALALVDRDGTILWYDSAIVSSRDLLDPDNVATFVLDLLSTLPRVGR